MRALQYLTALSLLLVVMLFPFGDYVPLDPDEPAAADGSLIAGRVRTIFDYDPLLGAFGETRPDPDDPRNFQPTAAAATLLACLRPWIGRSVSLRDISISLPPCKRITACAAARRRAFGFAARALRLSSSGNGQPE
jgi:hypothetical protein